MGWPGIDVSELFVPFLFVALRVQALLEPTMGISMVATSRVVVASHRACGNGGGIATSHAITIGHKAIASNWWRWAPMVPRLVGAELRVLGLKTSEADGFAEAKTRTSSAFTTIEGKTLRSCLHNALAISLMFSSDSQNRRRLDVFASASEYLRKRQGSQSHTLRSAGQSREWILNQVAQGGFDEHLNMMERPLRMSVSVAVVRGGLSLSFAGTHGPSVPRRGEHVGLPRAPRTGGRVPRPSRFVCGNAGLGCALVVSQGLRGWAMAIPPRDFGDMGRSHGPLLRLACRRLGKGWRQYGCGR